MWEQNRQYQGRACLVCQIQTRELVAPLGIVSGSFPCHHIHSDSEVHKGYMRWLHTKEGQGGEDGRSSPTAPR